MEEASKHGFELNLDYFKADIKTNGTNSEHSTDELNSVHISKSSG